MIPGLVNFGEKCRRVSQDPGVFVGEDRPRPQEEKSDENMSSYERQALCHTPSRHFL